MGSVISSVFALWKTSFSGLSRNVWLLTLVNFVNRLGSMVIVFLPIYLIQHLQLSIEDSGWVMSCFGIGSVAGNFLGGKLTDKFGFFWIQVISLFFNGIVLIVMNYAVSFYEIAFMVFMMSFVGDIFRPANSSAVSFFSSDETRTRSFSLIRLAFNLGWTVCPAIGGILVHLFGWTIMFWIDGLTCILAAIFFFFIFHGLHQRERIAQKLDTSPKEVTQSVYRDRPFLYFILLTFVNAFVFMQLVWTIPVFFKTSLGFNEAEVGLLMALNGLIVAVVEMPLIFKIENLRPIKHWIRLGLFLYSVSFFILNLPVAGLITAITCIIGLSIGEILVMPFSSNYVSNKAGTDKIGQYMALYSIAYAVANILAPFVGTQIIAKFGYSTLWTGLGVLAFVDYVGFRWLK